MTPSNISEILERLVRIETKVDARNDQEGRLRRLETSGAILCIMVIFLFAKAFGLNLNIPFA